MTREPHWAGEAEVVRQERSDEYERRMQQSEDEQLDPTYAPHGIGGTDE